MNVYPVNAVEAATLNSTEKASYSRLEDLHNRYLDYQVDFTSNDILLKGVWSNLIPMDSFIIGNTNAVSGRLELLNDEEVVFNQDFAIENLLTIIQIKDEFNKLDKKQINNFNLSLQGDQKISLGYIYTGETWILPRFVVSPKTHLQVRSQGGRTFTGQATGVQAETLRTFGATYNRVDNQEKKTFDDYISGVQTIVPHVIDPYPEAHDEFLPFFATVSNYGEADKRRENYFFWNFTCSWQEAK